jgi:hypothetical protein
MPCNVIDFTPLHNISKSSERSFLLLISGLLLVVPTFVAVLVIRCVDIPIFLLLLL